MAANFEIPSRLRMDGLCNARHLGGYRTKDGNTTKKESFVRCEGLDDVTAADLDRLYEFGIRTIIDLRSPDEVSEHPDPVESDERFAYINIPVFQEDASPAALAGKSVSMGQLYIYMLDGCMKAFRMIFNAILNAEGGVLFHCSAGKDRTGVLAALLLMLAGVDDETVMEEYTYTQILLAPAIKKLRANMQEGISDMQADAMLSASREYIKDAVDHINGVYKGADGYLKKLGFSDGSIEKLRGKLVYSEVQEKGA